MAHASRAQEQVEARKQIEGRTIAVMVGEQQEKELSERAAELKTWIAVGRQELAKVQETAQELARVGAAGGKIRGAHEGDARQAADQRERVVQRFSGEPRVH